MKNKFNTENNEGYEKLKNAFERADKDYLDSLELVPENEIHFSERYERRMERLKRNQKRPYWKLINTAGKRACAIILAVLIIFGGTMSVEAIREPVIGFIENVFEKFSELFVNNSDVENPPEIIEEIFTLTSLPEGYVETSCDISEWSVETYWSDGNTTLRLDQYTVDFKVTIDTEDSNFVKIDHNNMEIVYACKNNLTSVICHDNKYIFSIDWYCEASIEEMIGLIDSLDIK